LHAAQLRKCVPFELNHHLVLVLNTGVILYLSSIQINASHQSLLQNSKKRMIL